MRREVGNLKKTPRTADVNNKRHRGTCGAFGKEARMIAENREARMCVRVCVHGVGIFIYEQSDAGTA